MKLIMLGAPGAGKGTQAEKLSEHLNIPTISTGNIIRDALKSGSEMGRQVKQYMDAGQLVPDEVVIGIVRDRIAEDDCQNGFILDGFPRTIPQAEALDRMGVNIDRVIDIEVADDVITRRVSGRRVCPACGASYHIEHNPSIVADVCDKCGATLVQRKDDRPETVQERLKVYHERTEPLIAYYKACGKLAVVEGQGTVAETTKLAFAALEG